LIGLPLGLILGRTENKKDATSGASRFAWLLILFGALLVIVPEFIYLRDNFGTRMNTVFKFWYQAWLLWSVVAGYGAAIALSQARGLVRVAFLGLFTVAVSFGSFYPSLAINEKITDFLQREVPTLHLDGTTHFTYLSPEEHAVVEFLSSKPLGVLIEAVGGSYTGYARIATYSGQPNLLGWPGHEGQWRGGSEEMGSRSADIQRIYETSNWEETRDLLTFYNVRYIIVAPLEMNTYAVNVGKFERNLTKIYEQGGVVIYEVPDLPIVFSEMP
jgi:uncharacterized membrane protein